VNGDPRRSIKPRVAAPVRYVALTPQGAADEARDGGAERIRRAAVVMRYLFTIPAHERVMDRLDWTNPAVYPPPTGARR
jgi:hypothetical protein